MYAGHQTIPAPIFPTEGKLANSDAEEARKLHTAILDASAALREVDLAHNVAVQTMQATERELVDQVRSGQEDETREVELGDDLKAARVKADPVLHNHRRAAAEGRVQAAVQAYVAHCQTRFPELVAALAPGAEAATKALTDAIDALNPLYDRHQRAWGSLAALRDHQPLSRSQTTPEERALRDAWELGSYDPRTVPTPNEYMLALWHKTYRPELATEDPSADDVPSPAFG